MRDNDYVLLKAGIFILLVLAGVYWKVILFQECTKVFSAWYCIAR